MFLTQRRRSRYLAVLVHWSDQILLRRTEMTLAMRKHNHIVPAIEALRKHVCLLVERYRKMTLLRSTTPPLSRTVTVNPLLSASVESLSLPFHSAFSRALPASPQLGGADEVDHAGEKLAEITHD